MSDRCCRAGDGWRGRASVVTLSLALALVACKSRSGSATRSTASSSAKAFSRGAGEGVLETADGRTRRFLTYWPKSAGDHPPLLLVLHGGGGSADGARKTSFTHEAAERHGYFVVYPEGVSKRAFGKTMATWNSGACCGQAKEENVDDVGFLIALLDDLKKRFPYDPKRVYATGISNGGMMSSRLACERPDRVAGISAVGSPGYTCEDPEPVAVQIVHGTADPCARYAGGDACGGCWERVMSEVLHVPVPPRSFACTGAEDQVAFWRRVNGCTEATTQTHRKGNATCVRYAACKSGEPVSFCKIDGGGHTWPGADPGCDPKRRGCRIYGEVVGPISRDLDANDAMVKFFDASRP